MAAQHTRLWSIGAALATAFAIVAILVGTAAQSDAQSTYLQQSDLDVAIARWQANGPASYQLSYHESDHLSSIGTNRPNAVYTVIDGEITDVSQPAGGGITTGKTVEEMFAFLESRIGVSDAGLYAEFDPVDGHPLHYAEYWFMDFCLCAEALTEVHVGGLMPGTSPIFCGGLRATMFGTPGNDDLRARGYVSHLDNYENVIVGFGGDDTVRGSWGRDHICAGEGDDVIYAGTGDDRVLGGDGDRVLGGDGDDVIYGGGGDDYLRGNRGSDTVNGDDGDDFVEGGYGNDRLNGGGGNDQ